MVTAKRILLLSPSHKRSRCLVSPGQSDGGPKPITSPGFLLSGGIHFQRSSLLRSERAVKTNMWWGLLLSYQISVQRRESHFRELRCASLVSPPPQT